MFNINGIIGMEIIDLKSIDILSDTAHPGGSRGAKM